MIITHEIVTRATGTLDQLLDMGGDIPPTPALADVLAVLRNLSFIVEVTPELKDNATARRATHEAAAILSAFGG